MNLISSINNNNTFIYSSFESEAQRELMNPERQNDQHQTVGWINIRQVLSFDLGSMPRFQPYMAYVLRVHRDKFQDYPKSVQPTIADWMEFIFRGTDNTSELIFL